MILVTVPKGALDNKPPHGQPCNRCGVCCMAMPCELGRFLFQQKEGRCPALEKDGEGFGCGLLQVGIPELRDAAMLLIGSGDGCDARFNGEPREEAFSKALDEKYERLSPELNRAREMWFISTKDGD